MERLAAAVSLFRRKRARVGHERWYRHVARDLFPVDRDHRRVIAVRSACVRRVRDVGRAGRRIHDRRAGLALREDRRSHEHVSVSA